MRYNPLISYKYGISTNKWDKLINSMISKNGWDWLYKNYKNINNEKFNSDKSWIKGIQISKRLINNYNKLGDIKYSLLDMDLEFNKLKETFDFITFICLKHQINIPYFINGFVIQEMLFMSLMMEIIRQDKHKFFGDFANDINCEFLPIRKINNYYIENNKIHFIFEIKAIDLTAVNNTLKKESISQVLDIVFNNLDKFLEFQDKILGNPLNYPKEVLLKTFQLSLESIKKDNNLTLKFNTNEIKINNNIIDEEIETLGLIKKSFTNTKSFNYALKNENHYLNIFFKDEINVIFIDNKPIPIFKNFYKSIKYGLYEKGIYFGSYKYKRELINELQKGKEFIKKLECPATKKQIKIIDELIEFLKQDKRVSDYITFKELSRHSKATKKQIKSLLKKIFSNDKAKTFEKIYNKIVLLQKSIKE